MKDMSMPYISFPNVDMSLLNSILVKISSEDTIKKAISDEKKFKGAFKYDKNTPVSDEIKQELTTNLESYFNPFKFLVNSFFNQHAKKYQPLAKALVEVNLEELVEQTEALLEDASLEHVITMIRFLKKNGLHSSQLNRILEDEKLMKQITVTEKEQPAKQKSTADIRTQMNNLLDELINDLVEQSAVDALLEEKEKLVEAAQRKVKNLDRKLKQVTEENELNKKNYANEIKRTASLSEQTDEKEQKIVVFTTEVENLKLVNTQQEELLKTTKKTLQQQLANEKARAKENVEKLKLEHSEQTDTLEQQVKQVNEQYETLLAQVQQIQKKETEQQTVIQYLEQQVRDLQFKLEQVMPPVQIPSNDTTAIKTAATNRLADMGFGKPAPEQNPYESADDFDDLFGLDENKPSF